MRYTSIQRYYNCGRIQSVEQRIDFGLFFDVAVCDSDNVCHETYRWQHVDDRWHQISKLEPMVVWD